MKDSQWTKFALGVIGSVLLLTAIFSFMEGQGALQPRTIGLIFFFGTVLLYAVVGVLSSARKVADYYVAGRDIPALYNGMAGAANWMSAASVIGMAGTIYMLGYDGLAYIMGWTGGYVLLALLIAPYVRKMRAYTVPDFMAARYGGNVARGVSVFSAVAMNIVYLIPQFMGVGMIASRFLGLPFEWGVFVALAVILLTTFSGGMRGVTWVSVAQYLIALTAYVVPLVLLSIRLTGSPIPWLSYGQALSEITAFEAANNMTSYIQPFTNMSMLNTLGLIFCLMVGTVGLPHVLTRFYTVKSVRESRISVGWCLLFIVLIYASAPAMAALVRNDIYQNLVGTPIADMPAWVESWGEQDMVTVTDVNNDGILAYEGLELHPDMIVTGAPEIANMPYTVSGLIGAGGMAAAVSTSLGLLMVLAAGVAHDIYKKMINPDASEGAVLFWSRAVLVVVAALCALAALSRPALIVAMVAWAFSIAAASFFPAIFLGIWWRRANATGAVAGMIVGLTVTITYIIISHFYGIQIFGILPVNAGLFGVPANFLVTYFVSMATEAPPEDIQDLVTELRYPRATREIGEGN
ncbi:sodium:solute symporter family protein [Dethiobacter alkaliphilus]|uniref:sodium:solute symporter family protein n=1 Tax=Dethiobacter alkaliphilus TaxID=427926 RepID=UPI0022273E29|nr:sodium:solute symporter family protein [Dethiobacter alkaliphilus]MCW3489847.1 cation acetate symporter [Dethiobacter alkaliphilus]